MYPFQAANYDKKSANKTYKNKNEWKFVHSPLVVDKLHVRMAGNADSVDSNAAAAAAVVVVAVDDILAMLPDIADIADTVARIAGSLQ